METTLAIMQPYFFPYIGYFSLMYYADKFILFDTVQYDRKGWMHRNRVLKPDRNSWQYIRTGVIKPDYTTKIEDVKIEQNDSWRKLIFRQLEHYRTSAPYYKETINLIQQALLAPAKTLTMLNKHAIETVLDYLGLECQVEVFSDMGLSINGVKHAGQWAFRICKELEASEYVNPVGGRDIFDSDEFLASGIGLCFIENNLTEYSQKNQKFIPGLSILDVLMYNTQEETIKLIKEYVLHRS